MQIAILGWGSLIWQPKALEFDKEKGWQKDGPELPIEFSRISNDGRLTLVIDPKAEKIQTLYATSLYEKIDEAVLNLAIREGGSRKSIGFYNKESDKFSDQNFKFKKEIREWVANKDFDAVIWTDLGKKFKDKIGLKHNKDNVIKYLETLPNDKKIKAEEYIRKTPQQIRTKMREAIESQLQWEPIHTKNDPLQS